MKNGLFGLSTDEGKGRLCTIVSNTITTLITSINTGIFYTSFLLINGISLTNIGIVSFIPYIAACLGMFGPLILERFPKRRWVLAAGTVLYQGLNLIGITVLPWLLGGTKFLIPAFVAVLLISGSISNIVTNGYISWQLNFLPDEVRPKYYSVNFAVTQFVTLLFGLLMSLLADKTEGSPSFNILVYGIRFAAFAVAIIDVIIKSLPREYPYPKIEERVSVKSLFTIPFGNKAFLKATFLYSVVFATQYISSPFRDIFFLNDLHVTYTMISATDFVYLPVILIMSPFATKFVRKIGWVKAFLFSFVFLFLAKAGYGFMSVDRVWVFYAVRILAHFASVFVSISSANMPYLDMPEENRVTFYSFRMLAVNIATFAAVMLGTWGISLFEKYADYMPFGMTPIQTLIVLSGVLSGLFAVLFLPGEAKKKSAVK